MLRNVLTSVTGRDVSDDYADAVRKQLDSALRLAVRESYSKDRWGQLTARGALISYTSPDTGEERWANYYTDDAVEELEEADDRAEAEARYEENIQALADCAGTGPAWWQVTDVDDVPTRDDDEDDEDL
ncbi:hypothetical protein [Streptosporangium saharense]|uniref:hypothetical protein n=1 Tax=Streptosporangium saharense TaxID=1706840 RepID=UPI003318AD01